jgi:hypothetical protein
LAHSLSGQAQFSQVPWLLADFTNDLPGKILEGHHYKSQWKITEP